MSTHPPPRPPRPIVRPTQKQARQRRSVLGGVLVLVFALMAYACTSSDSGKPAASGSKPGSTTSETQDRSRTIHGSGRTSTDGSVRTSGLAAVPKKPYPGWVDPATSGEPWSSKVEGLLTFRGNPT